MGLLGATDETRGSVLASEREEGWYTEKSDEEFRHSEQPCSPKQGRRSEGERYQTSCVWDL